MKYYVKVWIPVDDSSGEVYNSELEAEKVIESLSLMQPENRYEVVRVDDEEDDSWKREMAMEEGMLHGVEAYNDAMGWSIESPECIHCGGHGCEACEYE